MYYYRIIMCFILLGLLSCSGNKKIVDAEENFDAFYDRFHTDMEFQKTRIQFPLAGGSAQMEGTIPWTKDNWITMKVKIYDVDTDEFEVKYRKTEDEFVQSFQLKGSGFSAEYRFKRINKKWYLVYALDSNL